MSDQPTPDQPAKPDATPAAGPDATPDATPAAGPDAPPAAAQPGQPAFPPPAPESAPEAPQENKGLTLLKRFGVPVLIALAFIGYRIYDGQTAADRLEVGQCVSREDDDKLKKADCTSADAEFKVLHIKKDTSSSQAEAVCSPVEGTTATYFEGEKDGSKGDLICLGATK